MNKRIWTVLKENGYPAVRITVTVTDYPSGNASTIYSDDGVTLVNTGNVLTTDDNGYCEFYAANGHYNISESGTGIIARTITDIIIYDPSDTGLVNFDGIHITNSVIDTSQITVDDDSLVIRNNAEPTGTGMFSAIQILAGQAYTFILPAANGVLALLSDVTSYINSHDSESSTLSNKKIVPRLLTLADATSITPDSDQADICLHINTQALGNLTVNADDGTPNDGQRMYLRIKSAQAHALVFDESYVGTAQITLPATLSGANKTDRILFGWNNDTLKWVLLAVNFGEA